MLIDATELTQDTRIAADVIIAGGGMAGITLAKQLGDAGLDVAILESGGVTPNQRVQALYQGTTTLGAPGNETRELGDYLWSSRVRCFGGSGNRWGGKCAPLDPIDFEKRDWIAHSGWPVSRALLQPYYERACATLDLPTFEVDPARVMGAADPLFTERSALITVRPRRYSRTTGAIGTAYDVFKQGAAAHPRVRVYLNCNVMQVCLERDGERVESLALRELSGRRHTASGQVYILAMGGIENVRLMLVSNDVQRSGIGNQSDWLGRAFQGHTTITRALSTALVLHRPEAQLAMFNNQDLARPHAVLAVSDAIQRRTRQVNFTATLTPAPEALPASKAVQQLAQRLSGAALGVRRGAYFMIEHTPNRDSRLSLTPEVDELGLPRVRLDLRYNALELASFNQSLRLLAQELGRHAVGRLQWQDAGERLVQFMDSPSRHHMGATRMSSNPREGVVDEQCRVHGVANLYIAGSSVFPTSGIANPTLTLLALAHRLGDRLHALLKVGAKS